MQTSNKPLVLLFILFAISFQSCEKDYEVYEVNDITVLPVNSEKTKPKTDAQYISILYTNFFQEPIGPNKMLVAQNAISSIGDKQIAYEMLVSKYMNDPRVVLPSEKDMRADVESFVRNTYKRFLIRQPTEAELLWWINYIESQPQLTTELIFFAFATSNEHFHY